MSWNALHYAAIHKDIGVIAILLQQEKNLQLVDKKNHEGATPLILAVEVDIESFYFISNDYFFICTGQVDYLWLGSLASREDLNDIQDVLDLIQSLNTDLDDPSAEIEVIKESSETEDFWQTIQLHSNRQTTLIPTINIGDIDGIRFIFSLSC